MSSRASVALPDSSRKMTLITEITGVIAVVVSVLYLGLQIRDNTKVLRSQAHYNALSLAQRPMEMMIENESLANVVHRSYANPDAVSGDEWARFGTQPGGASPAFPPGAVPRKGVVLARQRLVVVPHPRDDPVQPRNDEQEDADHHAEPADVADPRRSTLQVALGLADR